jgi:hypothetical protein
MQAKDFRVPSMSEVRGEAIAAVVARLGIGKAGFFIRETMSQPVNYLDIKDHLFDRVTVTDICGEIQQNKLNQSS